MSLRVAITRTLPDAWATARRVRERGGEPVLAPLLTIVPCAFNTRVEGAQALIFTSANGVRAFPDARGARDRVVLAVGDATAEAAHVAGFADVRSADGGVAELAALAQAEFDPGAGALILIGGAHVAGDLVGDLTAAGFNVERRIAYEAVAANTLPAELSQSLDIVLFHSARAAEVFMRLGAPNAAQLTAGCLSPAVAQAAGPLWKRVIVAPAPREDALLAAVLGG